MRFIATISVFTMLATNAFAADPKAAADAARKDIQATLGFLPDFLKKVPDIALPGAWEEMKSLQMNPATAVPGKMKELIGLAVAAQIPCEYCIMAHTEFAKVNGATDAEIAEAVMMGALTRHWSTFMNGIVTDEAKFRGEVAKMVEFMKKGQPGPAVEVTDAASAFKEMEASFGVVPDFMKAFPPEAIVGAWKEVRDVEMSQTTAIPPKYKGLIGLGVAAQIPCRYCTIADTEFAKVGGSTDREIREAVAIASLVRHWSTYLNGMQIDKATFKKDIARLVKEMKKKMEKAKTAQR